MPSIWVWVGAMLFREVLEDEVADDPTKSAADGCLAIEEGKTAAKLEASIEEGEVGYGDRVESRYI
jgi:hypothetical protein